MRRFHNETIHWVLAGQEVPAREDWSAANVGPGGDEQSTIWIPRRFLKDNSQGAPLEAFRSSGRPLYAGRIAARPKILDQSARLIAQGSQIILQKTPLFFLYQTRDYSQFVDRNSEPYNIKGDSGISLDNSQGSLKYSISANSTINNGDSNGYALWPQDEINRIAFTIQADSKGGGAESSYQLRLNTYMGPTSLVVSPEHDWNVVDGNTVDYPLGSTCDMITLNLRRTGASTTTAAQLDVTLKDLRVNGRILGDTMFASEGAKILGDYLGFDTTQVFTSGMNVLPVAWLPTSAEGLDQLLTLLAGFDDWVWLVEQSSSLPSSIPALIFAPWGYNGRSWHVALESMCTEDLDDLEIYNSVVQPYTTLAQVPGQVVVTASPDPLDYTKKYNNGTAMVNTFPAPSLSDPQPNDTLPLSVASVLLGQVSKPQARGPITIYEMNDSNGNPVSRYEIRSGDLITIDDRNPYLGEQRVVKVEYAEDKVVATVTEVISAASLIAYATARRTRR